MSRQSSPTIISVKRKPTKTLSYILSDPSFPALTSPTGKVPKSPALRNSTLSHCI